MEDFKHQLLVLKQLFRGLVPMDQSQAISMVRETLHDLQGLVRSKLASDAMKTIHSVAETLIQETYGINSDLLPHVCPPETLVGPNSWVAGQDESLTSPRYLVPEGADGGDLLTNALYDTLRRNESDTGRHSINTLLSPLPSAQPRPPSVSTVLHNLEPVREPSVVSRHIEEGFTTIVCPTPIAAISTLQAQNLLDAETQPLTPSTSTNLFCIQDNGLKQTRPKLPSIYNNVSETSTVRPDEGIANESLKQQASIFGGIQNSGNSNGKFSAQFSPAPNSLTPTQLSSPDPTKQIDSNVLRDFRTYACADCSYVAIHRQNLHRHRKNIHSDNSKSLKLFPCKECGKEYKTKSAVNEHYSYAHDTSNRNLKCDQCDRSFVQRKDLNRHHKLCHEGSRNHECGLCHRLFKLPAHLKRHLLKVHDVEIKR